MDPLENFENNRMSVVYFEKPGSDILKTGYLKKLKTGKKKFFVLRSTSSSGPSRLEYYDSEKKYKAGHLPKRLIPLHKCFNINKKSDTKQKLAIALYIQDDCFSVIADNVEEFDEWLNLLLEYQNEYFNLYDEIEPKLHFEYVWSITIRPKGLSINKSNLCGQYRLCLSKVAIYLYKPNSEKAEYIFQFASIRRCGHRDSFFYMEVGRSAPTGDGELWIQVEDKDIAQNLHEEVLKHMRESSSVEETASFRQRSSTGLSNRHTSDDPMRHRTNSEGLIPHGSPRRHRVPQETKRPQSAVVTSRPPTTTSVSDPRQSLMGSSPLSSPHMYVNELAVPPHGHRFRSDSAESHGSRSSVMSTDTACIFGSSPAEMFIYPANRSMTPESLPKSITEESSSYLDMSPGQVSPTPSPPRERPERPGSAHSGSGSDSHDSSKVDGYMEMQPGSSVGSEKNNSSYLDMAPQSSHIEKALPSETGYLMMGPASQQISSNPIAIRPAKEPGYMDMAPSSQPLPTVKEGGSGEAYLPMTPTGTSPSSASDLKPAKVISYLSDDSMSGDFPKRAYSVGSRPVSKIITHRHHHNPETTTTKQSVSDNGRSSSAPHLIIQKIKRENPLLKNNPLLNNPYMSMDGSNNYSPMNNYLNSDADSFMEMDFYRPRTASESFGSRPRSSSFNKVFAQGHRPRSSSYGQSSRGGKMGSFESVRTTSKDLLHRMSHEFVGRFSNPSSRTSSLESLGRIDNQSRCSNQSDYVEMHLDKKDSNSGYIDMTLPGGSSKSRSGASRSSSNQSLSSSPAVLGFISPVSSDKHLSDIKIVKASGHIVQKSTGFHPHSTSDIQSQTLFSPLSYASSSGSRSPSVTGRSSTGSGRESEEESYVPFEPAQTKRDHKMLKNQDSSLRSNKKQEKGKHKSNKKTGRNSPVVPQEHAKYSPKTERASKGKTVTEPESSYLEYEPGSVISEVNAGIEEIHQIQVGQTENRNMEVSVPSDASGALSGKHSVESSSEHIQNKSASIKGQSSMDHKPTSVKGLSSVEHINTEESGYMDYEPPQPEKLSDSVKSKECNETKVSKESSIQSNSGNKSCSSLRRNNSSNTSFDGDKPPVMEKKESYTYMDFNPSSHQVEEDVGEVKSPTRVRSYIATTSMENECTSINQPLKPLPQFKDNEDKDRKSIQKVQSMKAESSASKIDSVSQKTTSNQKQGITRQKSNSVEKEITKQTINEANMSLRDSSKSQKKKERRKEGVKKKEKSDCENSVKPLINVPLKDDTEDDGYVGLDFSKDVSERTQDNPSVGLQLSKTSGDNKKEVSLQVNKSDSAPIKLKALPVPEVCENKPLTKVEGREVPKGNKLPFPSIKLNVENRKGRKISTSPRGKESQPLPPLPTRKSSASSLDEMYLEESVVRKETESLDQEKVHKPPKLIMPAPELHKQNSMPCMILPVELLTQKVQNTSPSSIELISSPRSRHSCSDLTSAYEQMTYPSKEFIPENQSSPQNLTPPSGTQPQLTPPSGGQPQLNYASLDLGSSENVNNGDPKSPRIKSRHSSSADEANGPPLSYAEIDFKMSESLKNSNQARECKFSFE